MNLRDVLTYRDMQRKAKARAEYELLQLRRREVEALEKIAKVRSIENNID
jgi:hypothetical protein